MSFPAGTSRRRRPSGGSGNRRRNLLLAAAGAAAFVLFFSSGIAGFYTDYLWFKDLGVSQVFTGVLRARLLLLAFFLGAAFLLVWGNLRIAERLGPRGPRRGPEDEMVQRYREAVGSHGGKVRLAVAATLAFLMAAGVGGRWEEFLLFRNQVPFGTRDPQFGRDVSFYVFDLPFRTFVVNWLLFALILTTLVTSAFHYLNGGIRLQVAQQRGASPQVKAHISVLLAAIAFVKAYGYWLERFELVYSERGFAQGAFYTDVKARLPALGLLTLISVAAGVLLLANIYRRGFALPAVSTGLWLFVTVLVGSAYPAIIQQFRVKPAENSLETPYIQRNIDATRAAFGLTNVEVKSFDYTEAPGAVTGETLQDDVATIRNIRLWDPNERLARVTWQQQQSFRPYYQVLDVDVDRYRLNDQPNQTQVVLATRELKPTELPQDNWVNRHLAYTHGYGAVVAPANAVTPDGFPDYSLRDLPPTGTPELGQPRIYVGEQGDDGGANDYAIVRTKQPEIDFQRPDGSDETSQYAGATGVELGSTARRLAFAVRYREVNVLTSPFITGESKVLYVRGVKERVRKVAPFLTLDSDPYPVVTPDKRIVWIADAYTTSSRYPYSQSVGARGSLAGVNYARNSVKAVVDAYDGTVTLYAVDGNDPVLKAYSKTFPGLFTDPGTLTGAEADDYRALTEHFRYPEDLFALQANLLGRYHITNPNEFFSATDRWNVSPDPGVQATRAQQGGAAALPGAQRAGGGLGVTSLSAGQGGRIPPTYQLQRFPGEEEERFVLTVPYVPFDREDKRLQLTAFLTARSDPGEYGKLILFRTPAGQQINGPSLVASNILADSTISQQISLLNQEGSSVLFGNILLVPVDRSIVYVRPLYLQADQNPVPKLVRVIAVYGNKSVMKNTLAEALTELFPGAPATLEQNAGPTTPPPPGSPPAPPGETALAGSVAALISRADAAFGEAQAALQKGNLAEYQKKVDEASALVRQAVQGSRAAAPPADAPTTTTTAATPSGPGATPPTTASG